MDEAPEASLLQTLVDSLNPEQQRAIAVWLQSQGLEAATVSIAVRRELRMQGAVAAALVESYEEWCAAPSAQPAIA